MGRCSDAKDRLIATAASLFHQRGYTAVSVADICEAADLRKGSFYHFYASKLDLALDAIDAYARQYEALVIASFRAGVSVPQQIRAMFEAFGRLLEEGHARDGCLKGCPIGNLALEMADREEAIRRKIATVFEALTGAFETLIRTGVARGELAVDNPRVSAETLVAMIEGAMVLTKTAKDPKVFSRLADVAVRAIEVPVRSPQPGPAPA
ncbi:MAG: TetR/AcrR family transcriptional regulator [Nannocystaceae bacterium]|nr:TetR/AcrR family transcriptional regulator [Nannocystaceae bacterium]